MAEPTLFERWYAGEELPDDLERQMFCEMFDREQRRRDTFEGILVPYPPQVEKHGSEHGSV
jgi:hypothetical protein